MTKHIYSDHNYYDHRGVKVKSPEYKTWCNVRAKNNGQFCQEWDTSFMNFINDMGCKPVAGDGKRNTITLRRYDDSLPYCKENCYWGAKKHNNDGKKITFNGLTMNMSEWDSHLNLDKGTISKLLIHHWPIDKALTATRDDVEKFKQHLKQCIGPTKQTSPNEKLITFNDLTMNMSEWERYLGFKPSTLKERLTRQNWAIEKALTTPVLKPTETRTITHTVDGITFTIPQLSKEYGVSENAIRHRIKSGRGFDDLIKPTLVERLPAPIVYIAKVFIQSKCYLKIGITYQTKQRFSDHKRNLNKIDAEIKKVAEYHLANEQEARYIEKIARESLINVDLGVDGFITENYKWSEFDKLRLSAVMEVMMADALVY